MMALIEIAPRGYFCARPEVVGTTEEEVVAAQNGTLAKDRDRVVAETLHRAAQVLAMAAPAGRA